jgi:hypothetical protein
MLNPTRKLIPGAGMIAVALLTLSAGSAGANAIKQRSFEDQVRGSDLVVVGRASGSEVSASGRLRGFRIADVEVINVLKGAETQGHIRVLVVGDEAERDLGMVPLNVTYIFCLQRTVDEGKPVYYSDDGSRAAWRVQPQE